MLIWSVVLMWCVKLRDGRVVRRMAEVWEITGLDLEDKPISLSCTEVISWDLFTGTFSPNTSEEVVARSYRLKQMVGANGLMIDELVEKLWIKTGYLAKMVRDKIFDCKEVSKRLFKYYRGMRRS